MKIRTLRNMGFDGKRTPANTIIEAPLSLARELIESGRAVEVEADAETEAVTETEGAQTFLDTGADEPEPKAKRRK